MYFCNDSIVCLTSWTFVPFVLELSSFLCMFFRWCCNTICSVGVVIKILCTFFLFFKVLLYVNVELVHRHMDPLFYIYSVFGISFLDHPRSMVEVGLLWYRWLNFLISTLQCGAASRSIFYFFCFFCNFQFFNLGLSLFYGKLWYYSQICVCIFL